MKIALQIPLHILEFKLFLVQKEHQVIYINTQIIDIVLLFFSH